MITYENMEKKYWLQKGFDSSRMELKDLEPLLVLLQDLERNLAHLYAHLHRLRLIIPRDVVPGSLGVVLVAEGREALRDTDAGAIELADDPLLLLRGRSDIRGVDEVTGPPERKRLVRKVERRHDLAHVLPDEALRQIGEEFFFRAVERVDGARSAHGRDTARLRLLVDDANELRADHVVAELALDDARAEALVDKLTASGLPALQVLARALRRPLALV